MKTVFAKKTEVAKNWYLIDADGEILGRLASRIAMLLRGKHKPIFTPNVDTGDFVVVINADKVQVTGNKLKSKLYHHHTGYIGNLKTQTLKERMQKSPEDVIRDAVWGMLPKGRLGRDLYTKLKVYRGASHPHTAQKPQSIKITKTKN